MGFLMARFAEGDQILGSVIAQSAARLNVMDLKTLCSPATIGNASHLAPGPRGRAGDRLQVQASIVVVWNASRSKRHLHVFKQLFPLGLRKTYYQSR